MSFDTDERSEPALTSGEPAEREADAGTPAGAEESVGITGSVTPGVRSRVIEREAVVEAVARLFAGESFLLTDVSLQAQPVVFFSGELAALTGHDPKIVTGTKRNPLHPHGVGEVGERAASMAVTRGRPVSAASRALKADGSSFDAEFGYFPVQDGDGKVTHLLTLVREASSEQQPGSALGGKGMAPPGPLEASGKFFTCGLLLHDDGRDELLWASPGFKYLTGVPVDEARASGIRALLHADDLGRFEHHFQSMRLLERRLERFRLVTRDGDPVMFETFTVRRGRDDEAGVTAVYCMMKDVSAMRPGVLTAPMSGHVDALTGLPTAHLLEDRIEQALLKARRDGTHVALAFLEMDNFDFVHDTFSRRHGERLVIEVARRLRRVLRGTDTLARVGRHEFALLLCDLPDERAAASVTEKVLSAIKTEYTDGTLTLKLSATVGLEVAEPENLQAHELARRASDALGRAREHEAGGFLFYDDRVDAGVRSQMALERELTRALLEEQLVLHYQPRVQLASGAVNSVEALLRWRHPMRGLLRPAEFVQLYEESQLGVRLFDWVLERALNQARRWQRLRTTRRVSVNVSPSVLASGEISSRVREALSRYDLHPALLELEISERTLQGTLEKAAAELEIIRGMGVKVALDDFGVANSSFALLKGLPLDGLKIDRSFILRLDDDSKQEEIDLLRAMIALGKSLQLRVTAEGIETKEQSSLLRQLKCDEGQGFLFSHPVPAEYVPAFA